MDILPSGTIFRELQDIFDTGCFPAQPTLEENWQQVNNKQESMSGVIVTSPTLRRRRLDVTNSLDMETMRFLFF